MAPQIAMTHATGLGPLPALLEARGGPKAVARAFASEGLPLALVEERSHRVPLRALVALFDRAARLGGDPRLGLAVGLAMAPTDYGRWVAYALQAPTLAGCVSRLARCIVLHQIGGTLVLEPRADGTVLWGYRLSVADGAGALQHNDHVLPVLARIVRDYCGADWTPLRMETSAPDPGDAAARADATAAPWRFDAPATGLVLPAAALWARRTAPAGTAGPPISSREVLADIRMQSQEDDVGRLAAVVALRLLDGHTDIDGAARLAGCGRRTLQRRLDAEGLSYRAVLERVRMDRARALIRETGAPLSEIADAAGYSDPAHFSRAFRRHFGRPPSAERDAVTHGAPLPGAGPGPAPGSGHASGASAPRAPEQA
jgi:AraC-like DNA-binding protein